MSITIEQARTLLANATKKYQNENIEHIKNIADLDAKNTNQDNLKVKHENFRLGFTKRALIILIATEQLLSKRFETQLALSKNNLDKELKGYVDKYQKEMEIPGNSAFVKSVSAELKAIEQISNSCYESALKNNVNHTRNIHQTRNIKAAPQNLRSVLRETTTIKDNTIIPELPKTTRNDTKRFIQPAPTGKFSYTESIRNIATQMIALHESVRARTRPNQDDINKEMQLYDKFEKLEQIMLKPGAVDPQTATSIKKVHDIFKSHQPLSEIPTEDQAEYLAVFLRVYNDLNLRGNNGSLDISDLVLLNELKSKIISLYVQIPLQLLTNNLRIQYKNFRESIKETQQANPSESEEKNTIDRPNSWSDYLSGVGNSALESAKRMASSLPNLPTYDETEQAAFKFERDKLLQKIDAFETELTKSQKKILPAEYDQQMKIIECRKKLLNSKDVIEFNNNWLALNKAVTEFSEMMNKIYYSQALNSLPARVINMLNDLKYRAAHDYITSAGYLGIEIVTPDIINNPPEEINAKNQIIENLIYAGQKEKYIALEKIKQNKSGVSDEINELQKKLVQASHVDKQAIERQLANLKIKLNIYNTQERFLTIKVPNAKALDIFYEQLLDNTQKLKDTEKENMSTFETINKEIHAIALRSIGVDAATHRRSTELDVKTTQVIHKPDKPIAPQTDPKILAQELFALYKELASKLESFNLDIASTDADYRKINNLHNKLKKLHSTTGQSQEIHNAVSNEIDKIFSELQYDKNSVKIILHQLGQPNIGDMLINAETAINKLPEIINARKNAKERLVSNRAQKILSKIEEIMNNRDNYIERLKKIQNQHQKNSTDTQTEFSNFKRELNHLRKTYDEIKSGIGNLSPSDHKTAVSIQSSTKLLEETRKKFEEAEKIIAHPQNLTQKDYQKLAPTRWVKSNIEINHNQRSQKNT